MDTQTVVGCISLALAFVGLIIGVVAHDTARKVVIATAIALALFGSFLFGEKLAAKSNSPGISAASTDSPSSSSPSIHLNSTGPTASTTRSRRLVIETSDSHDGVAVYSDPQGHAAPSNVSQRIPYGTRVDVKCYVDNESEMTSVHAFYLIAGGPWDGLYAVSDSFANGAGLGPNGVDLDPRVPSCS